MPIRDCSAAHCYEVWTVKHCCRASSAAMNPAQQMISAKTTHSAGTARPDLSIVIVASTKSLPAADSKAVITADPVHAVRVANCTESVRTAQQSVVTADVDVSVPSAHVNLLPGLDSVLGPVEPYVEAPPWPASLSVVSCCSICQQTCSRSRQGCFQQLRATPEPAALSSCCSVVNRHAVRLFEGACNGCSRQQRTLHCQAS